MTREPTLVGLQPVLEYESPLGTIRVVADPRVPPGSLFTEEALELLSPCPPCVRCKHKHRWSDCVCGCRWLTPAQWRERARWIRAQAISGTGPRSEIAPTFAEFKWARHIDAAHAWEREHRGRT